jgi:precorrin isomerase/sirohydrochlorin ferrochelatase
MSSVPRVPTESEFAASATSASATAPASAFADASSAAASSAAAGGRAYSIVLAAHGSRDPAAVKEVEALLELMRKRAPGRSITHGFLEFALPTIDEGVRAAIEAGAARIVMLPALLLAATHAKNDMPGELAVLKRDFPGVEFHFGAPMDLHPLLLRLAQQRIIEAETSSQRIVKRSDSCLVVVGRGTTDPDANSEVSKLARMLEEGLGFGASFVCYSGTAEPGLAQGLNRAARLGCERMVVFPYFLFDGVLVKRIYAAADELRARYPELEVLEAGYLGAHDDVAAVFLERAQEGLDGRANMNCSLCKYRVQIVGFEEEVGAPQQPHHMQVRGAALGLAAGTSQAAQEGGGLGPSRGAAQEGGGLDPSRGAAQEGGGLGPSRVAAQEGGGLRASRQSAREGGGLDPSRGSAPVEWRRYEPHPIEAESFRIIEAGRDWSGMPEGQRRVAQRLVHTSGDFNIVDELFFSAGSVEIGVRALLRCRRIVTDVTMVASGLKRSLLQQLDIDVWCGVHDRETHMLSENAGITRSAAGMRRAWEKWGNDIVLAIGDAPTAIAETTRLVRELGWRPQLVIGLPVGFVGTRESKDELRRCLQVPRITNSGTRGGSPWAASVVNAMMIGAVDYLAGAWGL